MTESPITIVFPLFPGVTQLDFTGPFQLFAQTPGLRPIAASLGGAPIAAQGLTFADLTPLEEIARADVICVPGGGGVTDAMQNPAYMEEVARLAASARYITAVCTGSLILAAAGLLVGKRATSHWAWRDSLALFGAIPENARVVRDGHILTGGGVTAGIDFALTVIAELTDAETAQVVQLGLEYAPAPPFAAGSPETAAPAILARVQDQSRRARPDRAATIAAIAAQRGQA
ncbi:DJ-1/PfpI family protein [Acidisoma silvae]|uniref:DJ-1/PfpI family protein n=1 Tax=Acidisoma silvae TaxID=2802396 RepID=A0A963YW65_9PROT|nr:DJ-1/PfpI family protein [Acidisoma silvae]MCB8877268.1 DJ-1/PfpI family protein [Acidisoma silvae]